MALLTVYRPLLTGGTLLCAAILFSSSTSAFTSLAFTYLDTGHAGTHGGGPASGEFVFLGDDPTKWEPGLNTASFHNFTPPAGPMSPGGASWSAMPAGTPFASALEGSEEHSNGGFHPDGDTSTDIETLITAAVDGLEYGIFNDALNVWAAAANFTNLGQVADGATMVPIGAVGDLEAFNGHLGDIRVGAFEFDGTGGDLAHGFQPGTEAIFGSGGTVAGDIHFDTAETWIDDPADGLGGRDFDFFTVALHEVGHALGLGHSNVDGSVMEEFYEGSRRALHADDIAGIIALYGVIPEPGTLAMAAISLFGLACRHPRMRTW